MVLTAPPKFRPKIWPRCGYTSHHWTRPDERIGEL